MKLRALLALSVAALLSFIPLSHADAPAATRIDVGFSPDGAAERLVIDAIRSARRSVRLVAYSFTAAPIVRALVDAKHRGVDVAVIVDRKHNLEQDSSGKARAALNLLVNAGIPTRTIAAFAIQHSKYVVIDGLHVQTGSYNYSASAARYNSENVLVLWHHADLAAAYLDNWRQLYERSQPYASTY
ncbi:MAG: endonuclease [Candidatus Accumulibacter sp. 66-26]|nr:phospholipase D family protein [Accumulibacter sp.]OJW51549.1 MAG: endonuclease [Candidatus Accumulibacter sp. 66-26]